MGLTIPELMAMQNGKGYATGDAPESLDPEGGLDHQGPGWRRTTV
jgi:hypothetical protein